MTTTAIARPTSHPPGLYVLFFTELWERYSFYSMVAILALYMNEALHFDVAHVGQIYGAYTAGVYVMPVAGGFIADRFLGFNRSIIVGGVLMMLGHLALGVEALPFFYTGLVLLACGSGLLKPNISTLVGNLYRDRPSLRDQGFNIYYMGVNIGAFMAQVAVSVLRVRYGWSIAFMSAAVAMLFSLVTFIAFNRHVAAAAVKVDDTSAEVKTLARSEVRARVITLLAIFGISLVFWLAPSGSPPGVLESLSGGLPGFFVLAVAVAYAIAVVFLEPFYVAAGFAMYLNRRAEIEAWDIEQEFRRAFAH